MSIEGNPAAHPATDSIALHSASALAMNVVKLASGLLASVILARGLLPEGRGEYAVILAGAQTFAMLGGVGIYNSCNYYVSGKIYTLRQLLPNVVVLNALLGISLIIVAVTLEDRVLGVLRLSKLENGLYIWIIFLTPLLLFQSSLSGLLYGARKIHHVNTWDSLSSILMVALLYGVLIVGRAGTKGAVAVFTGMKLIDVTAYSILAFRISGFALAVDLSIIRDLIVYGWKVHVGRSVQFLSYRLDQFLVVRYLGEAALGNYVIAVGLVEVLWLFPNSIGRVLLPHLAPETKLKRAAAAARVLRTTIFITLITVLFLGGLGVFLILFVYGPAYRPALVPFLLLVPGVVALTAHKILGPFFESSNLPAVPSIGSAIALVTSLTGNLLLIPFLQLRGVAIAASVSYFIQSLFLIFLFRRMTAASVASLFMIRSAELRSGWYLLRTTTAGILRHVRHAYPLLSIKHKAGP